MISKLVTISLLLSLLVSVLIFIGFWMDIISTSAFIIWAYILLGLAAVTTVVVGLVRWIIQIITAPKKAMGSLIGIGGLILVFVISYAISSDGSVSADVMKKFEVTSSLSHTIGMAIKSMYILGALAILAIVYTEVSKVFK